MASGQPRPVFPKRFSDSRLAPIASIHLQFVLQETKLAKANGSTRLQFFLSTSVATIVSATQRLGRVAPLVEKPARRHLPTFAIGEILRATRLRYAPGK